MKSKKIVHVTEAASDQEYLYDLLCCWTEKNGERWTIDVVDGVAITYCEISEHEDFSSL